LAAVERGLVQLLGLDLAIFPQSTDGLDILVDAVVRGWGDPYRQQRRVAATVELPGL